MNTYIENINKMECALQKTISMQALMDVARIFGRYPIDKELLFADDK